MVRPARSLAELRGNLNLGGLLGASTPSAETAGSSRNRVRPGGRSERVRQSVLRACLELLTEGKVELPIAEVAERSGVNRGTVYRWWPTQEALLSDAVAFHWDYRIDAPDTGTWAGDVRAVITQLAALGDEPVERAIMVTVATGRYPAFNEVVMSVWRHVLPHWLEMVARAVSRGEVSPEVDPASVLSMMMSPLSTKSLFVGRAMTPRELEFHITLVCRATAPKSPSTPATSGGDNRSRNNGSVRSRAQSPAKSTTRLASTKSPVSQRRARHS